MAACECATVIQVCVNRLRAIFLRLPRPLDEFYVVISVVVVVAVVVVVVAADIGYETTSAICYRGCPLGKTETLRNNERLLKTDSHYGYLVRPYWAK